MLSRAGGVECRPRHCLLSSAPGMTVSSIHPPLGISLKLVTFVADHLLGERRRGELRLLLELSPKDTFLEDTFPTAVQYYICGLEIGAVSVNW